MSKKTKKFINALLRATFSASVGTFVIGLVLLFYAFVAYTDCFFTTSPNFQDLAVVAPILNTMIVSNMVIGVFSFFLFFCIVKLTERHH